MSNIVRQEKNGEEYWQLVLTDLKKQFGEVVFANWFSSLSLFSWEKNEVVLTASSDFLRDWLRRNYLTAIRELFQKHENVIKSVTIITNRNQQLPVAPKNIEPAKVVNLTPSNIFAFDLRLDPNYNFSNFILGKENKQAYKAALQVVNNPGLTSANPLFIYGNVGVGKTHLIQAIAWHITEQHPNKKVLYLSAERFMYQFVRALKEANIMNFKEYFRSLDVLIIDDIQFIAKKSSTQEEFLHTFSAVQQAGGQVIMACDRAAGDLKAVDELITSRIIGGLTIKIDTPSYALRLAVIEAKFKQAGFVIGDEDAASISKEICDFIAASLPASIRDIEGAVKRVIAWHQSNPQQKFDLFTVKLVVDDMISCKEISVAVIQKAVAKYFGIELAQLLSSDRSRKISYARHVAIYLCKKKTLDSIVSIAKAFGGKNHATVLYGAKNIERLIHDGNSEIVKQLRMIEQAIVLDIA